MLTQNVKLCEWISGKVVFIIDENQIWWQWYVSEIIVLWVTMTHITFENVSHYNFLPLLIIPWSLVSECVFVLFVSRSLTRDLFLDSLFRAQLKGNCEYDGEEI
jgi:hypothetical protein